jgi:hypothetical protein
MPQLGLGLGAQINESNSFDPDALRYFATAGVTDATGRSQINTFVRGIKSLGLYNNMVCWPLRSTQNNSSGTTAYSLGGFGVYNGTLTNSPTWGTGGITFDGSNDYINFGNSNSVRLLNGTISAWVKTSNAGGGFRGIMAKQNAWGLFYSDGVLVTYDWGAGATRSTGVNIADGNWKNVVMTFQSAITNGTRIYINGSLSLTTTITWVNDTQNLNGGGEASAGQYAICSGSIFSLYNRPLSAAEVLQNYNAARKRYGL